eukprot:357405-Chlamydomonas_euryale.AAC.11
MRSSTGPNTADRASRRRSRSVGVAPGSSAATARASTDSSRCSAASAAIAPGPDSPLPGAAIAARNPRDSCRAAAVHSDAVSCGACGGSTRASQAASSSRYPATHETCAGSQLGSDVPAAAAAARASSHLAAAAVQRALQ